ncbi:V-type ATPase, C subunit family protein [Metarhizium brunneum]
MALYAQRYMLRGFASRCYITSRRRISTLKVPDQTRFSYFLSPKDGTRDLLTNLSGHAVLENSRGHDAAVVLATPDLTKQLDDQEFISGLVKLLSASASISDFHLLCAVVDNIAPALGDVVPLQGISVLRGNVDSLLPQLWHPNPPREKADKDSVAALTFSVGKLTVTLPLTRTTFHNNRASTLLSNRYSLSQGQPELKDRKEKQWQHVQITLNQPVQSTTDLGLWAPLSPVTRARKITESFGNIVRGIEIGGKSTPASTELEDSVNTMLANRKATESDQGPMGVWAVITPETSESESLVLADAPDPADTLEGRIVQRKDVETTARYLEQQHQLGSRTYQVLSGGGGWGPKKGLLSLDPQQTHFALSEAEEMERFMKTMDNSGFAPPGVHIQFFVPAMASPEITTCPATGVVFGVPLGIETSGEAGTAPKGYLVADHFGALSSQGVYLSGRTDADSASCYESKISVPGCRIFVGNPEAKPGGFFNFLGSGSLADAGTIALM